MRNSSESIFFFFLDNQAESHANIEDAASLMFVLSARLINVTLAANLVLMANNVSLNPGPGSAPPASVKGLRIYHKYPQLT